MHPIENRAARARYTFLESWEAGLVLSGAEVKAVKKGMMNLKGSYVGIENGELWLKNAHISPYQQQNQPGYEPNRPRKLLLHKKEMLHLAGRLQQKGLTIVPKNVYSKHGLIKIQIALAQGLKKYDQRQKIKKRETDRAIRRTLKYHGHR